MLDKSLILAYTFAGLFLATVLWSFIMMVTHECQEYKEISNVGGCTQYECGVRYTDGTFGIYKNPVVGQKVCTK